MSEQAQAREELLTRLEQQQAEIAEQIRLLREQHDQATKSQIAEEHYQLWLQQHEVVSNSLTAATAALTMLGALAALPGDWTGGSPSAL